MAEGFTCDPTKLARAVQTIAADINAQVHEAIIIILDSGDLVVVNHNILVTKLQSKDYYVPVVIDVRGAEPHELSEFDTRTMLQRIVKCLLESIGGTSSIGADVRIKCAQQDSDIGLVLLAGWLLGYPYVYYYISVQTDISSLGCSALAMQPLIKHSIAAACEGGIAIPVQEFSVPACLADQLHSNSATSSSNIMNLHLSRLSGQSKFPIESTGALSHKTEIVTLPHVIL
jgi:hypothetical protein